MANIIVDYSELGNRFHKYNDNFWNMNMDPGYPEAACPAVGDVVTLTGYRVDSYTSSETASVQFHYMEEGGTGYIIEANTRDGGLPIYAAGVDEAIASGTVSFTITDVEEGDGVWIVAMVFGTPPIEEKALGGNAVAFFKEKMEDMVGDLSELQTTDKSSTVAAINELAENGSIGMERVTEEGYADGYLYTTLSGGDRIGFTLDDGEDSALLYFDDSYPNIRVAGLTYVDAGLAAKADASAVPTNISQLTNDANYQNATQVSSAIATAVGQITEFSFEVVQTLPATGNTSTIYLVPITGSAQNTYDEYLYVNNAWEKIGSTDIDLSNYVQFTDLATVATTGDYNDLTNLPEGMVVLEYGTSTWADFLAAYNDNRVVYCKASSGSDPSVGDKTRLAFMAYVTNPTNPTLVEFQYYRSVTTKSASNQTDQVVVYKLASNGTWSVETRNTNVKIAAGTNMTSSYSGGVLTLNATVPAQQQANWSQTDTAAVDYIKNKPTIPTVNNATLTIQKNGTNVATFTANASSNVTANITVPTITMQTTDPGEGATLAANSFIAVYQ